MATLSLTLPMAQEVIDHFNTVYPNEINMYHEEYNKPFLIIRVNDTKQGIISSKGSMKPQGQVIDTGILDAILMTQGKVRLHLIKGLRAELKANAKEV